jgi:hypothetical protein
MRPSTQFSRQVVRLSVLVEPMLMNGPKSKPGNPYYGQPLPFTPQVTSYIDWGGCSQCGSSELPYTYSFSRHIPAVTSPWRWSWATGRTLTTQTIA